MSKLASAATLGALPPSIDVGEKVTFELLFPQPPPTNPTVQYHFDFGDGHATGWIPKPWAVHPYNSSGTQHASAMIRVGETLLSRNIFRADVEVRPRSSPTPSATASLPITPSPYSPSPTAIVPGGFITAPPSGSRANVASPTATRSPRKPITITASPSSNGGPPHDKSVAHLLHSRCWCRRGGIVWNTKADQTDLSSALE